MFISMFAALKLLLRVHDQSIIVLISAQSFGIISSVKRAAGSLIGGRSDSISIRYKLN